MIIFEGEHGSVDYDHLAITNDGTRNIIAIVRCVIRVKNQIPGTAMCPDSIKREACSKLKKLVAELEEDLN